MIAPIPDISEFQGETDVVGMLETSYGIFVRLGYGTATGIQKDARFDENWAKARTGDKPRFAYVYAYPGRSSGAIQAQGAAAVLGQLQPSEGLMLDIEDDLIYGRAIIASDDVWAADFVNTAKQLLGPIAISYMDTNLKNRFAWSALRATGSALMEANYGPNDGQSHDFPAPAPWSNTALHQYTSQGTLAGRHPIDLSEFDGDADGLMRLTLQGAAPAPAPIPSPVPAPVGGNGTSYTVAKAIPGYVTAANAAAHSASNSTVPMGTYFVYNQAAGMVNVSRVQGVPGWWINPGDNVGVVPAVGAPAGHFTIAKPLPGFYTAADAQNHTHQVNTVQPGDYFVFNTYNGMVNVTTAQGAPGTWINPSDNSGGGTNSNSSDGGSTFQLGHSTPGYVTAADAAAQRNSNSTAPAGTYAVFNRAEGMVNITRTAGQPGWWINPSA